MPFSSARSMTGCSGRLPRTKTMQSMSIISAVRELIGSGTLLGFPVLGSNYPGVLLFILAPGGYITLGLVMVAFNAVMKKIDGRRRAAEGSVA